MRGSFLPAVVAALLAVSPRAHGGNGEHAAEGGARPAQLLVLVAMSPTCGACPDITEHLLPLIKSRYRDRIAVEVLNLNKMEDYRKLVQYERHYNSLENADAKVFAGNAYLAGSGSIRRRLVEVIREQVATGRRTWVPGSQSSGVGTTVLAEQKEAVRAVENRLLGFTVVAVVGAGLVDGVNPCAFATMVFLLSVLVSAGKTRAELALVGVAFSGAVLVTYTVLGLGLLTAVKVFSVSAGGGRIVTIGAGALAAIMSFVSLLDFVILVRTGDANKILLGMPKSVKARIRGTVARGMRRTAVAGAFACGVAVSLLEAQCTGQIYLPTIAFILKESSLWLTAFGFLLAYNVAFISPLILLFLLVLLGASSEGAACFLRGHLPALKLRMCCAFAFLAVVLFLSA